MDEQQRPRLLPTQPARMACVQWILMSAGIAVSAPLLVGCPPSHSQQVVEYRTSPNGRHLHDSLIAEVELIAELERFQSEEAFTSDDLANHLREMRGKLDAELAIQPFLELQLAAFSGNFASPGPCSDREGGAGRGRQASVAAAAVPTLGEFAATSDEFVTAQQRISAGKGRYYNECAWLFPIPAGYGYYKHWETNPSQGTRATEAGYEVQLVPGGNHVRVIIWRHGCGRVWCQRGWYDTNFFVMFRKRG